MNEYDAINKLFNWLKEFKPNDLCNEDDVDTKFVIPLFQHLGYPENCRRGKYPINTYSPGKSGRKPEIDHAFFSEDNPDKQNADNSLIAVESKSPEKIELEAAKVQVEFYSSYLKPVCVVITNGYSIKVIKRHRHRADEILFDLSIDTLKLRKFVLDFYSQLNFHIIKRIKETATNEFTHRQYLQIENVLRNHPDLLELLQKGDFVPTIERNGRELIIAKPKAAITCQLPLALDSGKCQIEFSDAMLRGLIIKLKHEHILQYLVPGRYTPPQWQARKFIQPLHDGGFQLSIDHITAVLTQADAEDLCYCVDQIVDAYMTTIMETENVLEAWGYPLEKIYEETYGYEILSITMETWKELMRFANSHANSSVLGYEFYTSRSSIAIETKTVIHTEIIPKVHIGVDMLPNEREVSSVYLAPKYDKAWQNNVGPRGFWTASYTKAWVIEKLLPYIQNGYAKDYLNSKTHPQEFWKIDDSQSFAFHLDVIHEWVCNCFHINAPTRLFISYCQELIQLLEHARHIKVERSRLEYIAQRMLLLEMSGKEVSGFQETWKLEDIQPILVRNLEHLRRVSYINHGRLDYMFRAHCVMFQDFTIDSTQIALNNFKKALWPLYERASLEIRLRRSRL